MKQLAFHNVCKIAMLAALSLIGLPGCTEDSLVEDEPAAQNDETAQEGAYYIMLDVEALGFNETSTTATRSTDDNGYDQSGDMSFQAPTSDEKIKSTTLYIFRIAKGGSSTSQFLATFYQKYHFTSGTVLKLSSEDFDLNGYWYYALVLANNTDLCPSEGQTFSDWIVHPYGADGPLLYKEGYNLIRGLENGYMYMSNCLQWKWSTSSYSITFLPSLNSYILPSEAQAKAKPVTIYLQHGAAKFTVAQTQTDGGLNYWANDGTQDIDILSTSIQGDDEAFWQSAPQITSTRHLYDGARIKFIAHSYHNMNSCAFPIQYLYGTDYGAGMYKKNRNGTTSTSLYGSSGVLRNDYFYTKFSNSSTYMLMYWTYTPRYHSYTNANRTPDFQTADYDSDDAVWDEGGAFYSTTNPYTGRTISSISTLGNIAYYHRRPFEEQAWQDLSEPTYVTENCQNYTDMHRSQATSMLLCAVWRPDGEEFKGVDSEGRPRSVIYCGGHLYSDQTFVEKIYDLCEEHNLFNKGEAFGTRTGNVIDMAAWQDCLHRITTGRQANETTTPYLLQDDNFPETPNYGNRKTDEKILRGWLNDSLNGGVMRYEYGRCYYLVYPRHFSDSNSGGKTQYTGGDYQINHLGRYGVVRNHWYELKVDDVHLPGYPYIPRAIPRSFSEDSTDPNLSDKKLDDAQDDVYLEASFEQAKWKKKTYVKTEDK